MGVADRLHPRDAWIFNAALEQMHEAALVYDACRRANEKNMTRADALAADPQVSARMDRATIDRLTSPGNYLGLAPEMVDRVLAASKR